MRRQSGFNLIHKSDLINMLRGLYIVYKNNQAALEVLTVLAAMLGEPAESVKNNA